MNHSSVYHPPQHNHSSIGNGGNYGSFPSSPNTASNNYHQQQYSASSSPSIVGSSSFNNGSTANGNNNTMNGMMNGNTILHQPPSSPYNSVHSHHHNIPPPSSQSTPVSSQYYGDNYSTSEYSRPNTSEYHSMNGTMTPQTPSYQNASPQYGNNANNFIYNIPPSQQSQQQHNYHNGVNNSYQFVNNQNNNSNNGMNRMSNNQNNSSPPMHVNQQTSEPIPENSPDLKLGDLEYHPIACICCRKMHKQCDKKLPSCQRCLSKGITCEYKTPRRMRYPNQSKQKQPQSTTTEEYQQPVEPKKKKKKTDSKDNLTPKSNSPLDLENITPPNTTLTSKLPQNLSKKNIIDIYYSMICDHFIFIDKSVLEKYVLSKSNDDADDSELPLKKEMQAFFFSVTALVEQRLGIDCSEKSAKKARDCLSKLFDEMNNFVIACSYANLGSYEIGSGRVKLSRFYFHNSKFYFESMDDAEKSKLSEYEKALQKYLTSVEIVNADNDLGITTMIQDIPKVFHYTTGHHLPQEIIKATQQEVSPSNCLDYLKIVEMIASYLNKYFRGMATKTRGEKEMEMYDKGSNLCQGLLMNGLRVGVLTKAGYGKDLIEESSLRITYASESEFFPFLPVIVIPHVALAARIHLQIVKKIENGTRQNHQKGLTFHNTAGPIDYFDILAKDYRSLIILSKRFKRVSVCYGSLLDEIKEILGRRAESQQNNDASSTNNSNTVSTPITDEALLHPLSLDSSSLPPLSFLLGSMNDNTPTQPQQSSSQKSSLDGYTSNTSTLQQSIFNSIIQSPIKSPSQQQELYFADPFFTHEDLQQIFSPHTYGDFEDGEFSFNVK